MSSKVVRVLEGNLEQDKDYRWMVGADGLDEILDTLQGETIIVTITARR